MIKVTCINTVLTPELTRGKEYNAKPDPTDTDFYLVKNNNGEEQFYAKSRFETVKVKKNAK